MNQNLNLNENNRFVQLSYESGQSWLQILKRRATDYLSIIIHLYCLSERYVQCVAPYLVKVNCLKSCLGLYRFDSFNEAFEVWLGRLYLALVCILCTFTMKKALSVKMFTFIGPLPCSFENRVC